MVKVKATKASKIYNKALKEFHRIVEEGEEFEVTEERFKFLNGGNGYHVVFVERAEQFTPTTASNTVTISKPEPKAPIIEEKVITENPDIFIIEPGKEPVQVDENLQPIKKAKKISKKSSKKKVESSEG